MTTWRFLFLSVLVHLILWLIVLTRPPVNLGNSQPVEVTLVSKKTQEKARNDMKHKTIVRQALPPLDMLKPEPPKDPKYLSERDQNVKKEMQAKNPGLTVNRDNLYSENNGKPEDGNSDSNNDGQDDSRSTSNGEPRNNRLKKLGRRFFSQYSTSGEYLPDVTEGPITALNTERFVYYSFFSRIEERIRPLWERNIRDAQLRLPVSVQKQVLGHDWITNLEILIDQNGNYEATFVQQTCGVDEIDRAAIQAFKEASFFPNPPKGMLEKDGRIHLKYAFIVVGNPTAWAQQSGSSGNN